MIGASLSFCCSMFFFWVESLVQKRINNYINNLKWAIRNERQINIMIEHPKKKTHDGIKMKMK